MGRLKQSSLKVELVAASCAWHGQSTSVDEEVSCAMCSMCHIICFGDFGAWLVGGHKCIKVHVRSV
jgi:hypothetical protein